MCTVKAHCSPFHDYQRPLAATRSYKTCIAQVEGTYLHGLGIDSWGNRIYRLDILLASCTELHDHQDTLASTLLCRTCTLLLLYTMPHACQCLAMGS